MTEEDTRPETLAGNLATRGVFWTRIHQRLEASQAALEHKLNPGQEEKRRILRARTKLLAQEAEASERGTSFFEVLEFVLAQEHYAMESKYVSEVHPLSDLTSLPGTPSFVLGLINVRGEILSVIDLKRLLDFSPSVPTNSQKVIIVHSSQMELGVLADNVVGSRSIAPDDLQDSLPALTGMRAEYVKGIAKDSLVALEMERILSDPRIIVDDSDANQDDSADMIPRGSQ